MLRVNALRVRFGDHTAVDGVSFAVERGEVVAVVGASGSGKTTLLRVIAGLEQPSEGAVELDGRDLAGVPVHERNVGFMFQDYALFPHRDVAGNVAFGLEMAGENDPGPRVSEVLEWVGLSGFGDRDIANLSGGEQQRVALARTMAPRPDVVLLDEPLGALDRPLRARLLPEVAALLDEVDVPALYVTHDLSEAFTIADRIALMDGGRLLQVATPSDLWHRPAGEAVARFIGYRSIVDITIQGGIATTPWGAVDTDLPDGAHRVGLRPDAVRIDPDGPLVGEVEGGTFDAGIHHLTVRCLNTGIAVDSPRAYATGEAVRLTIASDGLVPIQAL